MTTERFLQYVHRETKYTYFLVYYLYYIGNYKRQEQSLESFKRVNS